MKRLLNIIKCKILMKQVECALNGSEKMVDWLSKVYLAKPEKDTEEDKIKLYKILDNDDLLGGDIE